MNRSLALGGNGAPGLVAAVVLVVVLLALFAASGALTLGPRPLADVDLQRTGMSLMLTLIPAYLLAAWSVGMRRSLELVERLRPQLPDHDAADLAAKAIQSGLRSTWKWGCVAGIGLGLLNTQPLAVVRESENLLRDGSLSVGQIVMWATIGVVLGVSYARARAFRELGEQVHFDLFGLEHLRPLAMAGIVDVGLVAGAVLFTPLQALDAEFRWFNYHFAVIVALPVSAFLLVWPLVPLHRRLLADRAARIEAVEIALEGEPERTRGDADGLRNLETLLAHRDRLREARTWPLGMRLLSRVLFYLVIPPLAWAGAALVERVVESFLGNS